LHLICKHRITAGYKLVVQSRREIYFRNDALKILNATAEAKPPWNLIAKGKINFSFTTLKHRHPRLLRKDVEGKVLIWVAGGIGKT